MPAKQSLLPILQRQQLIGFSLSPPRGLGWFVVEGVRAGLSHYRGKSMMPTVEETLGDGVIECVSDSGVNKIPPGLNDPGR